MGRPCQKCSPIQAEAGPRLPLGQRRHQPRWRGSRLRAGCGQGPASPHESWGPCPLPRPSAELGRPRCLQTTADTRGVPCSSSLCPVTRGCGKPPVPFGPVSSFLHSDSACVLFAYWDKCLRHLLSEHSLPTCARARDPSPVGDQDHAAHGALIPAAPSPGSPPSWGVCEPVCCSGPASQGCSRPASPRGLSCTFTDPRPRVPFRDEQSLLRARGPSRGPGRLSWGCMPTFRAAPAPGPWGRGLKHPSPQRRPCLASPTSSRPAAAGADNHSGLRTSSRTFHRLLASATVAL